MFYKFLRSTVRIIFWIINGHLHIHNSNYIPEGNYILAAPHRTWWEPFLFAIAAKNTEFVVIAKKELFKNPIYKFLLKKCNAFPVDRANPGPSAIKIPVKELKAGQRSFMIFPSGTRHSDQLKSGVFIIAKLANKPIVPVIYQGPLSFKGILKRQNVEIRFGKPIYLDRKIKINNENTPILYAKLENAWQELDNEQNPNFKYIPKY